MNIDQIATRFTDHPDPAPGDVPIDHPYRRRWWLPIIGPTATCILNHLADLDDDSNWSVTLALQLAVTLGLGKGTGKQSPLIRSLDRITRFGFGYFDVEPGQDCNPCLNLYRTAGLVPQRLYRTWPSTLQQAHAIELAEL